MKRTLIVLMVVGMFAVRDVSADYSEDFSAGDGGYTVTNSGGPEVPWAYDGSSTWTTDGSADKGSPSHTRLTSPVITIAGNGPVELSFDHRYSIEGGNWDGGAVFASVNGGGFTQILSGDFSANGYTNTAGLIGNHDLNGGDGFNGDSPGYANGNITSVASLGSLSAGDSLELQFLMANDEFARGNSSPNWQLDSVSVSNAVPEPSTIVLAILACLSVSGLALRRRRRA